jgi:hypothetical protein
MRTKQVPKTATGSPSHELRIIGGQWKRSKIKVIDKPGLRPTPDRVRETLFNWLGQDLTGLPEDGGRAFLQHNRDIGMLTDHELVVLGLPKKTFFYSRAGKDSDVFAPTQDSQATAAMRERLADATSVFQTAYEIYTGERFRLN